MQQHPKNVITVLKQFRVSRLVAEEYLPKTRPFIIN